MSAVRPRWVALPVLLALAAGWWLVGCSSSDTPRMEPTRLFAQVFAKVKSSAVEPVDDEELYRRAAVGIIEELQDPYALLLLPGESPPPPEDAPVPPGVFLDLRDGQVVIVATVPGSAADSAGVRAGDVLLGIDSISTADLDLDEVATELAGAVGSILTLRVRRSGARSAIALRVVRAELAPSGTTEASLLGGGVGRIRLFRFVPGVTDSVRERLEQLRRDGARSLVLDLRGTVGGRLEDGVAVADLFLESGEMLAQARSRPASDTARFVDRSASRFAAMPLAVLIDAGTAGAAEVVAGALQDHDRAAVMGTSSFGRGVTRSTFRLAEGVTLNLTTSLWLTPSGRQIQRPPRPESGDTLPRPQVKSEAGRVLVGGGGIVPDLQIAETGSGDPALAEARRVLARATRPEEVLALLTGPRS